MKAQFLHTIVAQPGYFLLYLNEGEIGRPETVRQEPVIAWSIEGSNLVPFPITYDGVDGHEAPLLRPDGTVLDLDTRWPSASAWLARLQSDWDKVEELESIAQQQLHEAFINQNGIQHAHEPVGQPRILSSSEITAIYAALDAVTASMRKGGSNG